MDSRAVCENATATGGGCAYVPLRSRKFGEDFEDQFTGATVTVSNGFTFTEAATPVVTHITPTTGMPGSRVEIFGSNLAAALDSDGEHTPPLDSNYYMSRFGFFEQFIDAEVWLGEDAPCPIVKHNDTYIYCVTYMNTMEENFPLTLWVHGKGSARHDVPGGLIQYRYDLFVDEIAVIGNSVETTAEATGSNYGGTKLRLTGGGFAEVHKTYGTSTTGGAVGKFMGSSLVTPIVKLCGSTARGSLDTAVPTTVQEGAPCTLFEGLWTGGVGCIVTYNSGSIIECVTEELPAGGVTDIKVVVDWNARPYSAECRLGEVLKKCEATDAGTCAAVTLDGNAATCTSAGACDHTAEACASSDGTDSGACAAATLDGTEEQDSATCTAAHASCTYTAEACVATDLAICHSADVFSGDVTPDFITPDSKKCESKGACTYTPPVPGSCNFTFTSSLTPKVLTMETMGGGFPDGNQPSGDYSAVAEAADFSVGDVVTFVLGGDGSADLSSTTLADYQVFRNPPAYAGDIGHAAGWATWEEDGVPLCSAKTLADGSDAGTKELTCTLAAHLPDYYRPAIKVKPFGWAEWDGIEPGAVGATGALYGAGQFIYGTKLAQADGSPVSARGPRMYIVPTIEEIDQTTGSAVGGAEVTITGQGLGDWSRRLEVLIGGAPCQVTGMSPDPWTLVFRQTAGHGWFGADELSKNSNDPTNPMYSILDTLGDISNRDSTDGQLTLKMVWPRMHRTQNQLIWRQGLDPTTTEAYCSNPLLTNKRECVAHNRWMPDVFCYNTECQVVNTLCTNGKFDTKEACETVNTWHEGTDPRFEPVDVFGSFAGLVKGGEQTALLEGLGHTGVEGDHYFSVGAKRPSASLHTAFPGPYTETTQVELYVLAGDLPAAGGTGADEVTCVTAPESADQSTAVGVMLAGNVGAVIDCADGASGTGYILFTEESARTRWGSGFHGDTADHFVCVQYSSQTAQWTYHKSGVNSNVLRTLEPRPSDVLVADVDYTADTVSAALGMSGSVGGIRYGFTAGDLQFLAGGPSSWHRNHRGGEFRVFGSYLLPNADRGPSGNLWTVDIQTCTSGGCVPAPCNEPPVPCGAPGTASGEVAEKHAACLVRPPRDRVCARLWCSQPERLVTECQVHMG